MDSNPYRVMSIVALSTLALATPSHSAAPAGSDVDRTVARCLKASSTVESSACLDREVQKATAAMTRAFDKLRAEDARTHGADYKDYDPTAEIRAAQTAWRRWMLSECEMRADLTRGTAGAIVKPACALKLTESRTADLTRISRDPAAY